MEDSLTFKGISQKTQRGHEKSNLFVNLALTLLYMYICAVQKSYKTVTD